MLLLLSSSSHKLLGNETSKRGWESLEVREEDGWTHKRSRIKHQWLCRGDLHPHLLPPSSASAPRKQAGGAGGPGPDAGCTRKPSRDREGARPAHQVTAVLTRQGVPLPLGSRPRYSQREADPRGHGRRSPSLNIPAHTGS